jgi:hypothetical protein
MRQAYRAYRCNALRRRSSSRQKKSLQGLATDDPEPAWRAMITVEKAVEEIKRHRDLLEEAAVRPKARKRRRSASKRTKRSKN